MFQSNHYVLLTWEFVHHRFCVHSTIWCGTMVDIFSGISASLRIDHKKCVSVDGAHHRQTPVAADIQNHNSGDGRESSHRLQAVQGKN